MSDGHKNHYMTGAIGVNIDKKGVQLNEPSKHGNKVNFKETIKDDKKSPAKETSKDGNKVTAKDTSKDDKKRTVKETSKDGEKGPAKGISKVYASSAESSAQSSTESMHTTVQSFANDQQQINDSTLPKASSLTKSEQDRAKRRRVPKLPFFGKSFARYHLAQRKWDKEKMKKANETAGKKKDA